MKGSIYEQVSSDKIHNLTLIDLKRVLKFKKVHMEYIFIKMSHEVKILLLVRKVFINLD